MSESLPSIILLSMWQQNNRNFAVLLVLIHNNYPITSGAYAHWYKKEALNSHVHCIIYLRKIALEYLEISE